MLRPRTEGVALAAFSFMRTTAPALEPFAGGSVMTASVEVRYMLYPAVRAKNLTEESTCPRFFSKYTERLPKPAATRAFATASIFLSRLGRARAPALFARTGAIAEAAN